MNTMWHCQKEYKGSSDEGKNNHAIITTALASPKYLFQQHARCVTKNLVQFDL